MFNVFAPGLMLTAFHWLWTCTQHNEHKVDSNQTCRITLIKPGARLKVQGPHPHLSPLNYSNVLAHLCTPATNTNLGEYVNSAGGQIWNPCSHVPTRPLHHQQALQTTGNFRKCRTGRYQIQNGFENWRSLGIPSSRVSPPKNSKVSTTSYKICCNYVLLYLTFLD